MKIMCSSAAVTILFLTILKVWKQYGHDDTLSFSWSKNSTSSAIVLGFGLVKVHILSDDDGDVYRSWAITFSSLDMIHRINRIQKMSVCLILYSIEIHRCSSCFYQGNIVLNIPLSMFWWHWRHSSWQQWVTERLPHKLSECLPESTSPRWPLDVWDWVLVYLGSQVDSMTGTSDFKKRKHLPWQQIWVIKTKETTH